MQTIERTLELNSSPNDVWRALTDPTELSGWFGDTTELTLAVGSEGWFGWEQHGKYAVRVEEYDPITRFVWRWTQSAGKRIDETHSTLVEWTLTPNNGGGTTLHLRESGFVRDEDRTRNDGGWTQELQHLQDFLNAD